MIKTRKLILYPSTENEKTLLCMIEATSALYRQIKEEVKPIDNLLISSFHFCAYGCLLRCFRAKCGENKSLRQSFCFFPRNAYQIDGQKIRLKVGKRFNYFDDIMEVPYTSERALDSMCAGLKIIFRKGQWIGLITVRE